MARSELGFRWYLVLFATALALRVGLASALGAHRHGVETAHEHASIANSLATGRGFRFNFFGPLDKPVLTSQQAPLVPGLLAGCYLVWGVEAPAAFVAMLLMQCVASSLTVVGISRLAATTDPRIGRWGGVLAAGYPPLIAGCLHVQALTWNLGWLTLLLLATQQCRSGSTRTGALLFVAGGVGGMLTDPILGVVIAGLLALLAWEAIRLRPFPLAERPLDQRAYLPRWALLGGIGATIALGIAPWTLRNYRVHSRFVLVKDSFFYVLWQGNNSVSEGTDKLLVADSGGAEVAGSWDPRKTSQAALQARRRAVSVNVCLSHEFITTLQALPSEIERMDRFRELALREIVDHPIRYLSLCGQRLRFWLWFDATNPRSSSVHYRISYLALLALALPGISLAIGRRERWSPILVAALGLTVTHVLVITSARFRIPLELLLLTPGALAAGSFATFLGRAIAWPRGRLAPSVT